MTSTTSLMIVLGAVAMLVAMNSIPTAVVAVQDKADAKYWDWVAYPLDPSGPKPRTDMVDGADNAAFVTVKNHAAPSSRPPPVVAAAAAAHAAAHATADAHKQPQAPQQQQPQAATLQPNHAQPAKTAQTKPPMPESDLKQYTDAVQTEIGF
eukprot:TRINITY_DN66852_c3_g1_i1.p1 TRINITY_DN66852_c3_g1~~TRINITY_DN66852_c3_g1_i1.p1  ORF type:complete len:164 (+),score=63.63 TRINITY_DN66852_c3_g1_i1:37-492(+)